MSGANSTPLGRINPVIGSGKKSSGLSLLKPSYISGSSGERISSSERTAERASSDRGVKREKVVENSYDYENYKNDFDGDSREDRKRKRKSRWQGDEKEKTFIPGMPTVLPSNMSKDQEEAYLLQLQIEELSRRLRSNDLGIAVNPEDRSPSPEPIYNNEGKRLNTREYRTRKRLEEERHACITRMAVVNPEYKPPTDYKPPLIKVSDKVMIPQDEHPEINFVGLLIGPRGNTLKSMEKDTLAKIIIRGKGSVKEGKVGRKDGAPMPGEDEPLHAYVTASNPEAVKKAVDRIKEIIRQGVEVPEGQNDLRRMQLRELALLNGTLRENEGPRCTNCGGSTHKSWQCPDKPNVTNSVLCTNCGGTGHLARDCRQLRAPGMPPIVDRQKIDEEYMSLMAELGEGPPPTSQPNHTPRNNNFGTGGTKALFDRQTMMRPLMAPPPPPHMEGGNPPPNGNWNHHQFGPGNQGSPHQRPPMSSGLNQPPPNMWPQQQQPPKFQGVPPPILPPPPPPPTAQSQTPNWMSQCPPPAPGGNHGGHHPGMSPMNHWQSPPPGPVPPPRPVGPPPTWGGGWGNGPAQSNGPPPMAGPRVGQGNMDIGALLSAPPPPPPS